MRIVLPKESVLLQFVWGHTTTLLDYYDDIVKHQAHQNLIYFSWIQSLYTYVKVCRMDRNLFDGSQG